MLVAAAKIIQKYKQQPPFKVKTVHETILKPDLRVVLREIFPNGLLIYHRLNIIMIWNIRA
jgi:hypothetical protein